MNGKPVFKLVSFSRVARPEGTPDELFTVGVPSMGPGYIRSDSLTVLDHQSAGTIVCFGATASGDPVGVELASGRVVWTYGSRWDRPDLLAHEPGFINSNIGCFTDCVRAAIVRFPYYSRGAELEECEAVSNELAETLRVIDPPAMIIDRFWSTLIDDMKNGDFATEDILGDNERS